tara:strand:- start:1493 stop:1759 length:267 start_codon:yes stop_codon:yes gene_type:complete
MKTIKEHIQDRIKSCNQNAYAAYSETDAQIWVQKRKTYEAWLEELTSYKGETELSWAHFNELAEIRARDADGDIGMADDYRYNEILGN